MYYLNCECGQYKNMTIINRAKIIDDAFHLAMARQMNVFIFWELTKHLSQETNYVAWYPMIKVFEYMSTIFPFLSYIDIKVMLINKYYLTKNVNFIFFIYLFNPFLSALDSFRFYISDEIQSNLNVNIKIKYEM